MKKLMIVLVAMIVALGMGIVYLVLVVNNIENEILITKAPGYDLARSILGDDFISPEEITKVYNIVYTDKQLARFWDTLPSQYTLMWCHNNNMMLVAGPPRAMTIGSVLSITFALGGALQAGNDFPWVVRDRGCKNDKVKTAWIALRKEPLEGSLNKVWEERNTLIKSPMVVPNVAEVVWGLATYKSVRNIFLLQRFQVRVSSFCHLENYSWETNHIAVGYFGDTGLCIYGRQFGRDNTVGLAAARRKF